MTGTNKKATPLTEEQLSEKEAQLQVLEAKLNTDREALDKEREEFDVLKSKTEADLAQQKSGLDELERDLLANTGAPEEVEEPEPGLEFKVEKENFKFKDSAPKNLRIGGKILSQKEIVKDKELLQKVIKTSHIEKIK
ncbi:hypothetical protein [Chryseobacterium sp. 2R14A]|uniref:hypothetical protein n=1 Tax=Chryseobacterium sp. 2R14A TaxID=3380353 RepID=UPI003CF57562